MGAVLYFAEDAFDLSVVQPLLTVALTLLVIAAIYSLGKMYVAVSDDPALSPGERARYRRNILLVGPLAALDLVLNRRPSRKEPE